MSILQWVECLYQRGRPAATALRGGTTGLGIAYSPCCPKVQGRQRGAVRSKLLQTGSHGPRRTGINQSLWALAFSNADTKPHCSLCFSLEHATVECDEYEEPKGASASSRQTTPTAASSSLWDSSPRQIYVQWNRYGCMAHSALSGTCAWNATSLTRQRNAHKPPATLPTPGRAFEALTASP